MAKVEFYSLGEVVLFNGKPHEIVEAHPFQHYVSSEADIFVYGLVDHQGYWKGHCLGRELEKASTTQVLTWKLFYGSYYDNWHRLKYRLWK